MQKSMHRKCSFFALTGGVGVCERNRGRHSVPWDFLGINRGFCLRFGLVSLEPEPGDI